MYLNLNPRRYLWPWDGEVWKPLKNELGPEFLIVVANFDHDHGGSVNHNWGKWQHLLSMTMNQALSHCPSNQTSLPPEMGVRPL